jgi:D-3-phosphoglycerate dehydrogenase
VDIFWFRLAYKIDSQVLSEKTKCKYLITPVTGIDHIDESLCEKLGIKIICLRGEYEFLNEVRATAEHTILLTLALLRNLVPSVNHVNNFQWLRDLFRGSELYKKNVGIIGLGRLGRIVADYFHAFGCNIFYYDIEEKNAPYKKIDTPDQLVQNSDIISIHIPYNKMNHHFISDTLLSRFKKNSILINTSRGGVIDGVDLLQQLKNKNIQGAALDVLEGEPDIEKNKLIAFAKKNHNLIITPHIGGNTFESFEKTEHFIYEKLINSIEH